jgi:hypothetical protein
MVFQETIGGPSKGVAILIEHSKIMTERKKPKISAAILFAVILKPKINKWDDFT